MQPNTITLGPPIEKEQSCKEALEMRVVSMGDSEFDFDNSLKVEINNFLFRHLHGGVTLEEMEDIACDLYEEMQRAHEKAQARSEKR